MHRGCSIAAHEYLVSSIFQKSLVVPLVSMSRIIFHAFPSRNYGFELSNSREWQFQCVRARCPARIRGATLSHPVLATLLLGGTHILLRPEQSSSICGPSNCLWCVSS